MEGEAEDIMDADMAMGEESAEVMTMGEEVMVIEEDWIEED
jgi:hypothetical protein